MPKKLKKITAMVDTNENPTPTLHKQVVTLFTTRQGKNDADDEYINRFNLRLHNMEMTGGEICYAAPN